jgi:hypothetical protein
MNYEHVFRLDTFGKERQDIHGNSYLGENMEFSLAQQQQPVCSGGETKVRLRLAKPRQDKQG